MKKIKIRKAFNYGFFGRIKETHPKKFDHNPGVFLDKDAGFLIAIDPADDISKFPSWHHLGFCLNSVTGTAPVGENEKVFAVGKPYEQAKRCLEITEKAIAPLGATLKDIMRTRIFVTDISKWQEFGRAHGE